MIFSGFPDQTRSVFQSVHRPCPDPCRKEAPGAKNMPEAIISNSFQENEKKKGFPAVQEIRNGDGDIKKTWIPKI